MDVKTCTKCRVILEASPDNFYRQKNGKYGLNSVCKSCSNDKTAEYRKKNPGKDREISKRYYGKNKETVKTKRKIYAENNPEKIKEKSEKYRKKNREKINKNLNKHYQKNKDEYIKKARLYRIENKEEVNKKAREYYHKNKGKRSRYNKSYREINKEELNRKHKEYRIANPSYDYEKREKRRALKLNASLGRLPHKYRDTVFESHKGNCWWCKGVLDKRDWHIDHYIPLSRGGAHSIDNMVASCPTCNLKKNNKLPHEFRNELI